MQRFVIVIRGAFTFKWSFWIIRASNFPNFSPSSSFMILAAFFKLKIKDDFQRGKYTLYYLGVDWKRTTDAMFIASVFYYRAR